MTTLEATAAAKELGQLGEVWIKDHSGRYNCERYFFIQVTGYPRAVSTSSTRLGPVGHSGICTLK
jgi:hypothetical protein